MRDKLVYPKLHDLLVTPSSLACYQKQQKQIVRNRERRVFDFDELTHYKFAFKAGISNLRTNRFSLGTKKTVGKITQPINSYTRFPEYFYFDQAIRKHLASSTENQPRILDVGSPKMVGLNLAATTQCEINLTDISELNVDEYRLMWHALERKAKGKAIFSLQDARSLEFRDAEFDVVYSMSVIEHIEGEAGDCKAVKEMLRVLKPDGLLVLSVPFGSRYIEQRRVGVAGGVRNTHDQQAYFFQRIYDRSAVERQILSELRSLDQVKTFTVWRRHKWAVGTFQSLSENVRGLLGFCNPLLSSLANQSASGIQNGFEVEYGPLHQARDLYGDLIIYGCKLAADKTP